MTMRAGYWVDLADYKFDDSTDTTWIHAMPLGNYTHPVYGDINITPERVKAFADGVTNKVRGQDLDIDYDHKEKINDAAGWVKQAEARDNGLWLNVEWTNTAKTKLQEKAYRYFSPEFQDEWVHPATKQKYVDVIFGGGLTNRPYMKGILPINMSELVAVPAKSDEGGKAMTPEQIKKYAAKFGLGEDATEDQVHAAIDAAELAPKVAPVDAAVSTELFELKTSLAEVKKLAETNDAMKPMVKLMESQQSTLETMQKQLNESQDAIRLSEIDGAVVKLNEIANKKGYTIPIPVREKIKNVYLLSESKKLSEAFTGAFEEVLNANLVQLGEKSKSYRSAGEGGNIDNEDDPRRKFSEAVNKLTEGDKGMTYAEAVEKAAQDDPDLYDEYREASYANQRSEI